LRLLPPALPPPFGGAPIITTPVGRGH
jgi:hypothetical protein